MVRQYYAFIKVKATAISEEKTIDSGTGEVIIANVSDTHAYLVNETNRKRGTKVAYVKRITSLVVNDIEKMSKAALNSRDKAIVAVLADCGFRGGELVSIRVKDVTHNANGSVSITCPEGKTGERTVVGDVCSADLAAWEYAHPLGDVSDAPLFCVIRKTGNSRPGDPMDIYTLFNLIRALGNRGEVLIDPETGISKIHPHALRHYSATESARMGLSLQDMMIRYGWSSFEMPLRYVHLVEKDANTNWERRRRLESEPEVPKTNICPHCHHGNAKNALYCSLCATPLTSAAKVTIRNTQCKRHKFCF